MHWFEKSKFGMFIHWGVYAGAFGNEWVKSDLKMTDEQYQKYVDQFEADRFDPEKWAEAAERAGMRYVVFTAKHHDGFCMFDTAFTDYSSMHYYGRDYLREVIDAFRARNFHIGIYYSLPDWHHPNYVIDARHPLRDFPAERDYAPYTEYLHNQVTELLSNYGKIDIIWFDGSYPDTKHIWNASELAAKIKSLQPEILISRLPGFDDFSTPEQSLPENSNVKCRWEGCQVINGQWGYTTQNVHWRSSEELVKMLVDHVSKGGNMLLNVGPTGRGTFDPHSSQILKEIGEWWNLHSRAILGCETAPEKFAVPEDCRATWNPVTHRLYIHLFSWQNRHLRLPGLAGCIRYARFLHDHSEIPFQRKEIKNCHIAGSTEFVAVLTLPVEKPQVAVPVVELILDPVEK